MFDIFNDFIGPAQIAAILILAQRGLEELHSRNNTRKLLNEGAKEFGRKFYPVVAIAHLGWIAAIFFLIPASAKIIWPLLVIYLLLQVLRYWTLATLGRFWTHRIISLQQAPIERRGPYALVRHPNYVITIAETFILPACFGAFGIAIVFGAMWSLVIRHKIGLEDRALASRR